MPITLTTTNVDTTLNSIKRHIYEEKGKITREMGQFLIDLAERAYEIKGIQNPRICAVSFVTSTITHARNY